MPPGKAAARPSARMTILRHRAIMAVVADENIGRNLRARGNALAALSPVALRYDVPGTAGYHQKFFHLQGHARAPGDHAWCCSSAAHLRLFRAVRLHGRQPGSFDRRTPAARRASGCRAGPGQAQTRVPQLLTTAFAVFQHLATKERLRGRAVDALASTGPPRCARWWRRCACCTAGKSAASACATCSDLPAQVAQLSELSFVASLDDPAAKHAQAQPGSGN